MAKNEIVLTNTKKQFNLFNALFKADNKHREAKSCSHKTLKEGKK
jgi:hypothetical protein